MDPSTRTLSFPDESKPHMSQFTDNSDHIKLGRKVYLRVFGGGSFAVIVAMFSLFSIYWGALWKTPARNLDGWLVDMDGAAIGNAVSQGLAQSSSQGKITWNVKSPADFPDGLNDIVNGILDEEAWVAVVVNSNATNHLMQAVSTADASYNGTSAITVFAEEARNENGFRSLIRPTVQQVLSVISEQFAAQFVKQISNQTTLPQLLNNAPQVVVSPLGYTIQNLRPFDIPVASAVTFVGLIYMLILSFFVVMIQLSARQLSGFDKYLTTRSLINLRLVSTFLAYFVLSVFYSLLTLAFQADFDRWYGRAGFVIFWMLNYVGMLSVGLALEAMITLLTQRFIPFFMILWIISNVSVCFLPIEVLPSVYRYGYAMPFYNVGRGVRAVLFGTKNDLGLNFGILIAWIAVSCIILPFSQILARRREQKTGAT